MLSNTPGLGDNQKQDANFPTEAASAADGGSADMTQPPMDGAAPVASVPDQGSIAPAETAASSADETPAVAEEAAGAPAASDASTSAVAEEAASAPPSAAPASPSGLRRGDLIEGTIISTSPTAVMVDVGASKPGMIPGYELERMGRRALEELKAGEPLAVYVVNPSDHRGELILSVNRAAEEIDWQRAETYRKSQEPYDTKVAGYNKGGLIVRFGRVRGFVPMSQMSAERRRRATTGGTPEESLGGMVGEQIVVKVMEVDRARNRLILSERTATRESREKRKADLISQLTVGETRTGRVVSLEDFGVFVDIGGAEGLVHLTELSWKHVTHPRELLKEGQEVTVEVISIDPDAKRIGLSMRRREPDPWDTVALNFAQGQLVKGEITKLTKFGAFARLVDLPEIEGLIHISELSDKRVAHPREVVKENDVLTLRVVKIDVKNRRLGLSLKAVMSKEYLDMDWMDMSGEG